ncbi:MAG: hypothetical protein ABIQ03_08385 [Burkholderiales bacterium]
MTSTRDECRWAGIGRGDAQGIGYPTLINDALRDCLDIQPEIDADTRKLVRQEVKAVLAQVKRQKKAAKPV